VVANCSGPAEQIEAERGRQPKLRAALRIGCTGRCQQRQQERLGPRAQTCIDHHALAYRKELPVSEPIRIQDLAPDEIRELLMDEGADMDEQQAAALRDFVQEIGGLENALAAIALLGELEDAA
jgi:hypothetical protein